MKSSLEKNIKEIKFTGEFFVPGKSGKRIEDDHMERYLFASRYVEGKTVLDIACGVGYAAPLIIKGGAIKYEGVDINEDLVNCANHMYGSKYVRYHVGEISTFNAGEKYDVIVCYETIEHLRHYQSALSNLYRLLNSEGLLLISSPNRLVTSPKALSISDKPQNKFHAQEFTPAELLNELRAVGFPAETMNTFGQRYHKLYKNKYLMRIGQVVFGYAASPVVTPMGDKNPRYFVIAAKKSLF